MKYLMIVFVSLTMFLAGCGDRVFNYDCYQMYVREKLDEYDVVNNTHRYFICNEFSVRAVRIKINKSDFENLVHVGDYVTVKDGRVIVVTQNK